eukprot:Hpha_TRINITY_DN16678_c2_g2::TRINITY_DN16678_c2_g2_i1::g.183886::m.183886
MPPEDDNGSDFDTSLSDSPRPGPRVVAEGVGDDESVEAAVALRALISQFGSLRTAFEHARSGSLAGAPAAAGGSVSGLAVLELLEEAGFGHVAEYICRRPRADGAVAGVDTLALKSFTFEDFGCLMDPQGTEQHIIEDLEYCERLCMPDEGTQVAHNGGQRGRGGSGVEKSKRTSEGRTRSGTRSGTVKASPRGGPRSPPKRRSEGTEERRKRTLAGMASAETRRLERANRELERQLKAAERQAELAQKQLAAGMNRERRLRSGSSTQPSRRGRDSQASRGARGTSSSAVSGDGAIADESDIVRPGSSEVGSEVRGCGRTPPELELGEMRQENAVLRARLSAEVFQGRAESLSPRRVQPDYDGKLEELSAARREAAAAEADARQLRGDLEGLKQELERMGRLKSTVEARAVSAEGARDLLLQEVEELRPSAAQLPLLQAQVGELEEKNNTWASLVESLKAEHFYMMTSWEESDKAVKAKQDALNESRRKELEHAQQEAERLRAVARDSEGSAAGMREQLQSLVRGRDDDAIEAQRLRDQSEDMTQQQQQMEADLASLRAQLCSAEDALKDERLDKTRVVEEFREREQSLERQRDEATEGRDRQLRRFKELKERYFTKKRALVDARMVAEARKVELAEQGASLAATQAESQAISRQLEHLQQLQQQMQEQLAQQLSSRRRMSGSQRHVNSPVGSPRDLTPPTWSGGSPAQRGDQVRSTSAYSNHGDGRGPGGKGPRRVTYRSTSNIPVEFAPPFCSAVRPEAPRVAILDNGPSKGCPYVRDSPVSSGTFRNIPPPTTKAYLVSTDGHLEVLPASKTSPPRRRLSGPSPPLPRRSSPRRSSGGPRSSSAPPRDATPTPSAGIVTPTPQPTKEDEAPPEPLSVPAPRTQDPPLPSPQKEKAGGFTSSGVSPEGDSYRGGSARPTPSQAGGVSSPADAEFRQDVPRRPRSLSHLEEANANVGGRTLSTLVSPEKILEVVSPDSLAETARTHPSAPRESFFVHGSSGPASMTQTPEKPHSYSPPEAAISPESEALEEEVEDTLRANAHALIIPAEGRKEDKPGASLLLFDKAGAQTEGVPRPDARVEIRKHSSSTRSSNSCMGHSPKEPETGGLRPKMPVQPGWSGEDSGYGSGRFDATSITAGTAPIDPTVAAMQGSARGSLPSTCHAPGEEMDGSARLPVTSSGDVPGGSARWEEAPDDSAEVMGGSARMAREPLPTPTASGHDAALGAGTPENRPQRKKAPPGLEVEPKGDKQPRSPRRGGSSRLRSGTMEGSHSDESHTFHSAPDTFADFDNDDDSIEFEEMPFDRRSSIPQQGSASRISKDSQRPPRRTAAVRSHSSPREDGR